LGNQLGLKQLTDFKNPNTKIDSMKVSPDGKHLLYFRNRKQLEILNINTGNIRKVKLIELKQLLRVRWGADNRTLIYIDERENHQVKYYDLITQQHKVLATLNAISLFSNNKGMPFAVTEKGLVDLTTEKVYPLPKNINITTAAFIFDQVDEYFYATDRNHKLYRWKSNEQMADVTHFDFSISSMDITDKHEVVFVTKTRRNTKIERLWWSVL
jgi:protease II